MKNQRIARGLAALALIAGLAVPARAGFDESKDIQRRVGDASPGQHESHVNDYRFQDEQIDIKPGDGLVRVLRTDQKVLVNDYQTAVFPLHNATPREIRNVMRLVTGLEGGRAEVIQDKVSHENFVQVIAPRFMIPYLREAVASLDVIWLKEYWDGSVDLYAKLQNRGDTAFVDRIASTYAGTEGFTTVDTTNNALRRLDEDYRISEYKRALEAIDIPANQVMLDVKIYEVSSRNDAKLGLDYIAWKNGPGRNLFAFAEGGYQEHQRAKGYTSIFDPFLGARIFVPGDTHEIINARAAEAYRAVNYLLPSNYIDFMQAKGTARIIKSTSLMVESSRHATLLDNQQQLAFVTTGSGIPSPTPSPTPGNGNTETDAAAPNGKLQKAADGTYFYDANGNGTKEAAEVALAAISNPDRGFGNVALDDFDRELNYSSVGTIGSRLSVRPFVGLESMELELSLNIAEENGLTADKLPIINSRRLHTTVRLMDGQPFVLAGLSTKTKVEQTAKMPWLGSLPIIGYAFGGETNLERDSDLVITITPHFYVSSQAHIKTPPRVDTAGLIVNGVTSLGLPEINHGYSMEWWPFNNSEKSEAPMESTTTSTPASQSAN